MQGLREPCAHDRHAGSLAGAGIHRFRRFGRAVHVSMNIKFGGKIRDVERPEDGFDLRCVRFLQKCGRIGFGSAGSVAIRVTPRVVQVVDDGIGLGLHGDVGTVRRQFRVQLVSNVEHHAQHGHADRGRQAHGDRDQQSAFELPAERAENHSKKEHDYLFPLTGNASTMRRASKFELRFCRIQPDNRTAQDCSRP